MTQCSICEEWRPREHVAPIHLTGSMVRSPVCMGCLVEAESYADSFAPFRSEHWQARRWEWLQRRLEAVLARAIELEQQA